MEKFLNVENEEDGEMDCSNVIGSSLPFTEGV